MYLFIYCHRFTITSFVNLTATVTLFLTVCLFCQKVFVLFFLWNILFLSAICQIMEVKWVLNSFYIDFYEMLWPWEQEGRRWDENQSRSARQRWSVIRFWGLNSSVWHYHKTGFQSVTDRLNVFWTTSTAPHQKKWYFMWIECNETERFGSMKS